MSTSESAAAAAHPISIFIDGSTYESPSRSVTESDLRHLTRPPIPDSKELWLDVPDAQDRLVEDSERLTLTSGMRFFTEPRELTIHIDRQSYAVAKKRMTGAELRAVPTPPVAEDRDLWLDIVDKRDKKIADDEVVRIHQDTRFFTAPGRINPGKRTEHL